MIDGDFECIMVFDSNGKFFFDFGNRDFLDLVGIIFDVINNVILVCDCSGNLIVVFKLDGEMILRIEIVEELVYVVFFVCGVSLVVCFNKFFFF